MSKNEDSDSGVKGGVGFGGLFKGLADLVEKLGDLAEKGENLSRTGELDFSEKSKNLKGVYGFSVKMGLGDQGVQVEPFGNVRTDERTGESVVQEIREPLVDIFEEEDHTLIVAEMPGISTEDVQLDIGDDLLTVYAEKGEKKYRKEILLPRNYARENITLSCNNGMVEIMCRN